MARGTNLGDERNQKIEKNLNFNINSSKNNVIGEYYFKSLTHQTNLEDDTNGKSGTKLQLNLNNLENGPYKNDDT